MASCEKCWGDAYMRALSKPDKTQVEHYNDLLKERKDNPCSLREQAGQFWDNVKQCDRREIMEEQEMECPNCQRVLTVMDDIGICGNCNEQIEMRRWNIQINTKSDQCPMRNKDGTCDVFAEKEPCSEEHCQKTGNWRRE